MLLSWFAHVLGSSYEVFCLEKECASGNGNEYSPDIFFRVINAIRCLNYVVSATKSGEVPRFIRCGCPVPP
jgi:hypothetical protein